MKKHFLLFCGLFTAATLCFTSCNDDDDDEKEGQSHKVEMIGDLYAEPCIDFLAYPEEVKEFMADYTLVDDLEDSQLYAGKYKEKYTMYTFESNFLEDAAVAFDETVSTTTLHNALKNKYQYESVSTTENGSTVRLYTHNSEEEVSIALVTGATNSVIKNMVIYIDEHDWSNKPAQHGTAVQAGKSITERMAAIAARVADSKK